MTTTHAARRVAIVGSSGAGKTCLATRLAAAESDARRVRLADRAEVGRYLARARAAERSAQPV